MLPELDAMLIQLLRGLQPADWTLPTVAGKWCVKDVVAHLLDGNIRILSMLRDGYEGEKATIHSYQSLLDFLNRLNADWVKAMKRVSPEMLVWLHTLTGPEYCRYYASLDPFGKAAFAVAWAGEQESRNWMHIAREYTEKFLHQQQIRHAMGNGELLVPTYYHPFLHIFMQALPHTYRNTKAPAGTSVKLVISGNAGGSWLVMSNGESWQFADPGTGNTPAAEVTIPQDIAWILFSKSIRADSVASRIDKQGPDHLTFPALEMISVMA